MQNLPHRYSVKATATTDTDVQLTSSGLPSLASAAPAEFGGPGDLWSPETLLAAAVADCFVLSFKAIARASKFEWLALGCDAEGVLERVDRVTHFTEFQLNVVLSVASGTDEKRARLLLEKAEQSCLITNSLKARCHLELAIESG